MKRNQYIYIFTLIVIFFVFPLSADKIREVADPLDESAIVNSLEMDIDSPSVQNEDDDITGEIIFDNSFHEKDKKPADDINLSKNKCQILARLRSEDRRWHLIEYRVKSNDTVWGMAKKFNIDSSIIIELNSLKSPGQIRKGQILLIPSKNGIYYTIRKGDTLTGISKKFNSEIAQIATLNNIDGADIQAGKKIFIPDAVEQKEPVIKKRINPEYDRIADSTESRGTKKKIEQKKTGTIFTWPLKGPVTSGFGYRKDPFSGNKRFHCGMDIGAEIGTPVKAAGNGRVIYSGWKGAYGYLVVISHEKNYITVYAHNSKNLVKTGEVIKKGDVVALSGNTGAVTGAHLHFEIRKGTVPLNPRRLIKK